MLCEEGRKEEAHCAVDPATRISGLAVVSPASAGGNLVLAVVDAPLSLFILFASGGKRDQAAASRWLRLARSWKKKKKKRGTNAECKAATLTPSTGGIELDRRRIFGEFTEQSGLTRT